MKQPKTIVFGYDELLLAGLEFFAQAKARVEAVVFPSNRTDRRAAEIRRIVKEKGFSTLEQPLRGKIDEFAENLRRLEPDLFFVWSYPMILPAKIIEIPKNGALNLHLGLLPEYRGVNGVRWALINGESATGVTLHLIDAGVDTGPIVTRGAYPIAPEDDFRTLLIKSRAAGLHLLKHVWPQIAAGRIGATRQDESKARYYSAAMDPGERIDWSRPNVEIHNLIRASVLPLGGVGAQWKGRRLIVRKSAPVDGDEPGARPGTVAKIDERGVEVVTGRGRLLLTAIEIDERRVSPAELSAMGLAAGIRFQNDGDDERHEKN